MRQSEELEGLTPEQYGNRASKSADIQALNTRIFYEFVRLKRISDTNIFTDLISNYNLVLQIISYLELQIVSVPKDTTK